MSNSLKPVMEWRHGIGMLPGARCDSESYYTPSFSEELEQNGSGLLDILIVEILTYLNHVADRFDLRKSITFNCRINESTFDEGSNLKLNQKTAEHFCQICRRGRLFVTTNVPNFHGVDNFEGIGTNGAWRTKGDFSVNELDSLVPVYRDSGRR